jgi:hypothetical protein
MATTTQRTAMVQIPAGVLAHLCMAANSGAFNATQLWGFTQVALQPYWIDTRTNGSAGNAAGNAAMRNVTPAKQQGGAMRNVTPAKQQGGANRKTRQASNARSKETVATLGTRTRNARSGSKRDQLVALIRFNPEGMARGQILEKLGLKGDKSGEMSVSNALSALTKKGAFLRRDGRYCPGPNIGAAATQEQAQLADA